MGFCALCQCLNQSVTPARSTFPAPRPLPALNPSTCVPCTDIQMRADNTGDLHVSVISRICHTSQPTGLPPWPASWCSGEGREQLYSALARGFCSDEASRLVGFPCWWRGLSHGGGWGPEGKQAAGNPPSPQPLLVQDLGIGSGEGGEGALGLGRDVCAAAGPLQPRRSMFRHVPRLCPASLHPGGSTPVRLQKERECSKA